MRFITLTAHFDGDQIRLDEPFELKRDTPLIVTVLPTDADASDASWSALAEESLARAYGPDEPDYSAKDVQ